MQRYGCVYSVRLKKRYRVWDLHRDIERTKINIRNMFCDIEVLITPMMSERLSSNSRPSPSSSTKPPSLQLSRISWVDIFHPGPTTKIISFITRLFPTALQNTTYVLSNTPTRPPKPIHNLPKAPRPIIQPPLRILIRSSNRGDALATPDRR